MSGTAVISIVFAAIWALVAIAASRPSRTSASKSLAVLSGLLAATHVTAVVWTSLAPLLLATWWLYALAVPTGRLTSRPRRLFALVAAAGLAVWSVTLMIDGATVDTPVFLAAAVAGLLAGGIACAVRAVRAPSDDRATLQWLAAACVLGAAFAVVCTATQLMVGTPRPVTASLAAALVFLPIAQLGALTILGPRPATRILKTAITTGGVAALVGAVYVVVVVGINGAPNRAERGVLVASLVAGVVAATLSIPFRHRLMLVAQTFVTGNEASADEVLATFGARMSRAVPMDELLLQFAESLRASMTGGAAEIWTGPDGSLTRVVSVPSLGSARIHLGASERVVVARTRIGGPGWTAIWLPGLFASDGPGIDHRVVPIAHLGALLGLVVVRRSAATGFTTEEEDALVGVARQLGLALHNVRLDSALQQSLTELADRNQELQASRLRLVTAADAARRDIERDLHDGAQQHLTSLAVKLGLARQSAEEGDTESVGRLLDDLYAEVRHTIEMLRDLAHGIYPPLLRDRGLDEALRNAAMRLPMSCSVSVDLPGRYLEQVETAVYFCCLEAMQNAGKHAGEGVSLVVRVNGDARALSFELSDDGVGFDPATTAFGSGFTNMRDRLGAIGGVLSIDSTPGTGTSVMGRIPTRTSQSGGRSGSRSMLDPRALQD